MLLVLSGNAILTLLLNHAVSESTSQREELGETYNCLLVWMANRDLAYIGGVSQVYTSRLDVCTLTPPPAIKEQVIHFLPRHHTTVPWSEPSSSGPCLVGTWP
mmetsp:Transcript_23037/g.41099  ORF Transcript_23037/g.41099 Transcript_23037/m.41099 type:complete len:103 (+) Transcript_23037:358-666(+)